jgi:hypothetical protein
MEWLRKPFKVKISFSANLKKCICSLLFRKFAHSGMTTIYSAHLVISTITPQMVAVFIKLKTVSFALLDILPGMLMGLSCKSPNVKFSHASPQSRHAWGGRSRFVSGAFFGEGMDCHVRARDGTPVCLLSVDCSEFRAQHIIL